MTERWVKCTRDGDGVTVWLNMTGACAVAPYVDEQGRVTKRTRIFWPAAATGMSCETVREPMGQFIPHAQPKPSVVPASADIKPFKQKPGSLKRR